MINEIEVYMLCSPLCGPSFRSRRRALAKGEPQSGMIEVHIHKKLYFAPPPSNPNPPKLYFPHKDPERSRRARSTVTLHLKIKGYTIAIVSTPLNPVQYIFS